MRVPVRVSGTCSGGHLTERDADLDPSGRSRLTWRGTCPTDGCGAYLLARRIKGRPAAPKPETSPPPATTPAPPRARRTVRKVTAYREPTNQPKPTRRARAAHSGPADVQQTAPVPAVAKPKPAVTEPERPGPADPEPRARRRLPRLSLGGPDARDADGWIVPGIY
jgi:hypothetical protein